MSLSTHVLDASTGRPAAGVPVTLTDAGGTLLASENTDDDGRIAGLADRLEPGVYRLRFDTATYFTAAEVTGFYPEIVVAFEVTDAAAKYHVPVLLSPYAYSTYRGS
ncbi:hydroxyisourate hydrolase [Mycobacterium sp. NPDC050041]|uniref:hydroxyisourate hydrolase n=1 Tax=Mycobacterium sp. NPDC050041 TaxID=3364293 RepID=UPI003C2CD5C5